MNKNNRFFDKGFLLLVLALLLCLSLFSCDDEGIPSDTQPSVTTKAPVTTEKPAYTQEDLDRVLSLVDQNKVIQVEVIFEYLYVGEFKTYEQIKEEVDAFILENVLLDKVETIDDATTVFLDSYLHVMGDKYACYYDPTAYDEYKEDLQGEYAGIGVEITLNEDRYIDVLSVFRDSPADRIGILPGDVLIAVNGEDIATIGYYETLSKVRGGIGTSVNLTISRDGELLSFDVVREMVTEITVEGELKNGYIGYVRISGFNDKTYEQFVDEYKRLISEGARGFIFDMRNNPGGTLDSVIAILEFILPDGPIVHLEYKDPTMNQSVSSIWEYRPIFPLLNKYYENHEIELPMVVITNGRTASAGELFTSSLNDYDVATLVGTKTYGKGVGQRGVALFDENGNADGSIVNITYFHYAPPFSENYDGVGIYPDILVELSEEAQKKNLHRLTEEEDTQLKAAIEELDRLLRIKNTIGK